MKTRIISGTAMVPILFGVLYLGGPVLTGACFLIGISGATEFCNGFNHMGIKPSKYIVYLAAVLLYAVNILNLDFEIYFFWFFISILFSLLYVFKIDERKLEDGMATLTAIFYVVFFSYHIVLVGQLEKYSLLLWLIFFSAFGSDIMAYFTGYFLGKHKLCPVLSPKKNRRRCDRRCDRRNVGMRGICILLSASHTFALHHLGSFRGGVQPNRGSLRFSV